MDLDRFISNVLNLKDKLSGIYIKAAGQVLDELADLNVSQMEEGILSSGKKIKPNYSANYAKFKGFKTPNLRLEGDFHSGVYVEIKGDDLMFDSTDSKTNKLTDKYSDDIFGIAKKNEQDRNDYIDDYLIEELDEYITR